MAALICLPIIFHLLATAFYLHHPIGPLLVLPFSGVLVIKKSCLLLGLTTVRDVIVSDERVEFSGTDSHGVSRTVFLLADNHLAALAIGRMLQGRSG